jgi:hypothetical protein
MAGKMSRNADRNNRSVTPPDDRARIDYPKRSPFYWTKAMADQDFSGSDRVNSVTFNRELWRGLKDANPLSGR